MTVPVTCKIDGCERPKRARGWCHTHWAQWRRTGDPIPTIIVNDDTARFWSKVDKRGPTECWPWTGYVDSDGYGRFRRTISPGQYTSEPAARTAYRMLVGPIPEFHQIDHVHALGCTRRDCVNPAHLEPVTPGENVRRAEPARRTHCPAGHEYTAENTSTTSGTGRTCVACNRERQAKQRERRRSQRKATPVSP